MPRKVVALALAVLLSGAAAAQPLAGAVPQPLWTVTGPSTPIRAGQAFDVTATVRLPVGWYQDADSEFLKFEPESARVVARSSSSPTLRAGKHSYTGTFTLTRTVVVDSPQPSLTFNVGWQICQVDGVCLLPMEDEVRLDVALRPGGIDFSFWGALLGAFVGGFLLNLMPCVFPVLALKAVGLASAAGTTLRARRRDALLFAVGGFGFLVLLGLVTAVLAAAGQRLDWGFSFQQPLFVWALALAFWVFALQLWGVWSWRGSPFSLSLGAVPGPVKSLAGGAFLVLAAAPCTAPLLGPALGFAFVQPPALIPLFFAAGGLGLVTPLLALQLWPGWARLLPKPGPWMVLVERVAGFFLGATVLYLLWVFTKQTSDGFVWPALVVLGLAALGFAAIGRWNKWAPVRWMGLVILAAAFSAAVPWTSRSLQASTEIKPGWTPYSREAIETALARGDSVFIDATAAWCATCQVNEATVLDKPDVTALFNRLGIVRVRADYTRPSPAIRDWLVTVKRAGLPVYALYRPGKPVFLFGELLGPGFSSELEKLVR